MIWVEIHCDVNADDLSRFDANYCVTQAGDNYGEGAPSVLVAYSFAREGALKAGWKRHGRWWICPGCAARGLRLPTTRHLPPGKGDGGGGE